MARLVSILNTELRKKAWNSILQMVMGGVVIYLITITAGPIYGCGPDNTHFADGMLSCARGEMHSLSKAMMVGGIGLAALCWGRAARVYEKQRRSAR